MTNPTLAVNTRELNEDEHSTILSLPWLDFILPIRFENGTEINEYHTDCPKCARVIKDTQIHATVTFSNDNSTALKLWSVCHDCKMIIPSEVRVRDDGSCLSKMGDGDWVTTQLVVPPAGFAARLRLSAARHVMPLPTDYDIDIDIRNIHESADNFLELVWQMPTLGTVLPIKFRNGEKRETFETRCDCGKWLAPADLRVDEIKRTDHAVAIRLQEICEQCMTVSPYTVRFQSNGGFYVKSGPHGGFWMRGACSQQLKPKTIIGKLQAALSPRTFKPPKLVAAATGKERPNEL